MKARQILSLGVATFATTLTFGTLLSADGVAAPPQDDVAAAANSLAPAMPAIAARFAVPVDDLVATRVQHDRIGMSHVRYAQHKHGLRVVGGDVVVHTDAAGNVRSVNGTARDATIAPTPALTLDVAIGFAQVATAARTDVGSTELVYVISTRDQSLHLAWEIELIGKDALLLDLVYVDAHDGAVVDRRPQVFTARSREIQDGDNCEFPFECLSAPTVATEGNPPTGDEGALAAYDNTGSTYDCYQELFGRDSFDGSGGTLTSIVHVLFPTPGGGTSGNNAAWVGQGINMMVYGDGDGQFMTQTALGFDVTAHELTHGVTSVTAQLAYQNESGALNEAWSDIMAAVCEAWKDGAVNDETWLIGEDIFTPGMAGDALRYMDDPTADAYLYPPELGGSRDFYGDRYAGTEDNGGVHLNSGIANLAFQLLVEGGTHPKGKTTFNVPGIGMESAGAIFQRALTQGYLTANSTFDQARAATEQVAEELYPGATKTAVSLAWAAVGVGAAPPMDTTPPTVEITSPTDGDDVAEGFTVEVNANDDMGVLRVDLTIDGVMVGSDATAPYSFTTDAALASGMHTIEATAVDGFNNEATDEITIADGEGGGCGCQSGGEPAAGALVLLGAALMLRRRAARQARVAA